MPSRPGGFCTRGRQSVSNAGGRAPGPCLVLVDNPAVELVVPSAVQLLLLNPVPDVDVLPARHLRNLGSCGCLPGPWSPCYEHIGYRGGCHLSSALQRVPCSGILVGDSVMTRAATRVLFCRGCSRSLALFVFGCSHWFPVSSFQASRLLAAPSQAVGEMMGAEHQ